MFMCETPEITCVTATVLDGHVTHTGITRTDILGDAVHLVVIQLFSDNRVTSSAKSLDFMSLLLLLHFTTLHSTYILY